MAVVIFMVMVIVVMIIYIYIYTIQVPMWRCTNEPVIGVAISLSTYSVDTLLSVGTTEVTGTSAIRERGCEGGHLL